jgi:Tfp pilus assembly protein PilX
MTQISTLREQRGVVTIFVSMILLLLITLLVITAYSLSTMNLKVVANVQAREEAIAAANVLINRTIDSDLWNINTAIEDSEVDLNGDGAADFLVDLAVPQCVRAIEVAGTSDASVDLEGMTSASAWNTIWELDATATEATTGTRVRVVQGVRLLLSTTLKNTHCT